MRGEASLGQQKVCLGDVWRDKSSLREKVNQELSNGVMGEKLCSRG